MVAKFAGAFIGYLLFKDFAPAILLVIALAVAGFFIVKNIFSKNPDQLMEHETNPIGQPQL